MCRKISRYEFAMWQNKEHDNRPQIDHSKTIHYSSGVTKTAAF